MNKSGKMKKLSLAVAALLAVNSAFVRPKQAQAMVAVFSGGAALPFITGAVLAGLGGISAISGAVSIPPEGTVGRSGTAYAMLAIGAAVLGLGIIVLDDQGQSHFDFNSIDSQKVALAGLTDSEIQAVHANADELNAVMDSVSSDLIAANDASAELAKKQLLTYRESIDPQAFSGAQKIAAELVKESQ